MKILHTSDWHLGKKLDGKDILSFQKSILDEVVEIAINKAVDIVVVAGDVFDGVSLQPKVLSTFLDVAGRITNGGERAMVITSGRRDNPQILDSLLPLCKRLNLAVYSSVGTIVDYNAESDYKVQPYDSGRGYIAYQNEKGEKIVIACVPYDVVLSRNSSETYEKAVVKALDTVSKRFSADTLNLVCANLNVVELTDTSDLIDFNDEICTSRIFPQDANYIALGGSHEGKVVDFSREAFYSGAIQAYNFDDDKMDKSVVVVSLSKDSDLRKEKIKLKSCKKLKRIRCASIDDAKEQLEKYYDFLIDLSLSTPDKIKSSELKMLQEYPNLLELNLHAPHKKVKQEENFDISNATEEEIFQTFYKLKMDKPVPNDVLELYLKLMEGENSETNIS